MGVAKNTESKTFCLNRITTTYVPFIKLDCGFLYFKPVRQIYLKQFQDEPILLKMFI